MIVNILSWEFWSYPVSDILDLTVECKLAECTAMCKIHEWNNVFHLGGLIFCDEMITVYGLINEIAS